MITDKNNNDVEMWWHMTLPGHDDMYYNTSSSGVSYYLRCQNFQHFSNWCRKFSRRIFSHLRYCKLQERYGSTYVVICLNSPPVGAAGMPSAQKARRPKEKYNCTKVGQIYMPLNSQQINCQTIANKLQVLSKLTDLSR